MPIYEYKCERCRKRTETIQKISDPPLRKCPHCGGPLRKLISSPAIKFSGSGFYITDYAKKSGVPAEPKKKSAPKKESGTPAEQAKAEKSGP
ncbi:MAG: zinc ribbon domain-containing protein [Candidatus Aminicenantes bacterium]|nr:zinc ribbon domain-containing protein [Candidatus Aminicenantes bacterium]